MCVCVCVQSMLWSTHIHNSCARKISGSRKNETESNGIWNWKCLPPIFGFINSWLFLKFFRWMSVYCGLRFLCILIPNDSRKHNNQPKKMKKAKRERKIKAPLHRMLHFSLCAFVWAVFVCILMAYTDVFFHSFVDILFIDFSVLFYEYINSFGKSLID